MANIRYYKDLRALQKRANQAIVRLEKLQIKSPAYQSVQADLEVLGRQASGDRGRRFSETGKATYNEYEAQKKILTDFLNMKTRTQAGAKQWVEDVWEGARENSDLKLEEAGVTKDMWLDFWDNMPSNHRDRILGSEVYVKILRTYTYKNRELSDDQKMTVEEIADAIKEATNVKAAYKKVGISYKDVSTVNSLGKL